MTEKNRLHLYTGPGKGKTSAAMGMVLRMAGHAKCVLLVQFLKDGTSGELEALRHVPNVTLFPMPPITKFVFAMTQAEKAETSRLQIQSVSDVCETIISIRPALIVLDEFVGALTTGILPEKSAGQLLEAALAVGETVVTGRDAPKWLIDRCDYISDIACVRHPYDTEHLSAREGVEW